MKRRLIGTWILSLLGSLAAVSGAFAANGSLDTASTEHISIAPFSIPVGPSGTTDIGMTRLGLRTAANGDTTSVSSITVQAISGGTFSDSWVTAIRVYFEKEGLDGEYFHGGTPVDARADSGTNTFSGGTATIALNPTIAKFTRPGGALNYFYVVVDLAGPGTVDTSTTLGVRITNVRYGLPDIGDTANYTPPLLSTTRNLDDYETTLDASYIGPASAAANGSKVPVLRLDFDVADATVTSNVDSIKVHRIYGLDNYATTVFLYADVNANGSFEPSPGADGAPIASAALSSAFATLNPTSVLPVTAAGKTYFVAVDMDGTNAQVGQYFGLNVDNPSTDIVFVDEIQDDNDIIPTEYAYVPGDDSGLYEYLQLGFINSTTADPAVDPANRFLINPPNDGNPPSVATTVPADGATGVSRNADITVLFNEYMTESSVEDPANFTISGGITPSSFTYTAATQTLVIALPTLDWGVTYTATVESTVQDFYGNAMASDYTWTFTVEAAQYPVVLSTAPAEGETNVTLQPTITATFSENVTGISGSSFKLYAGDPDLGGTEVTQVTASYNSTDWVATLVMNPPTFKLNYNTRYYVKVESDLVSDSDGLPLANQILGGVKTDKKWSFWTMPSTPPSVLGVTPNENATDVPIASAIQIVFSKQVLASSLTGNITVVEEATALPVSGTISPSAGSSNTATFTPDAPLDYLRQYRVTVSTGITDTEGTALSASKTWTFTTFGFTQATITNNRLGAGGGASQCLIFVPQVNPTDKVSVQVFTTTGKLVRTFYKNAAFSSVTVPIPWDGTNDKGQALGPGLYFVQIIAAGVKQTLKVLIVR